MLVDAAHVVLSRRDWAINLCCLPLAAGATTVLLSRRDWGPRCVPMLAGAANVVLSRRDWAINLCCLPFAAGATTLLLCYYSTTVLLSHQDWGPRCVPTLAGAAHLQTANVLLSRRGF